MPVKYLPTDRVDFQDFSVYVGQEATYGYGDLHPAKVTEIRRVKGGWAVFLQGYQYHHRDPNAQMGHQDWIIDWDTPRGNCVVVLNLKGKLRANQNHVTFGKAFAHYRWEL